MLGFIVFIFLICFSNPCRVSEVTHVFTALRNALIFSSDFPASFIVTKHKEEANIDKRHRMSDKMTHNFKYNTIDYEKIIYNQKTLTAGAKT